MDKKGFERIAAGLALSGAVGFVVSADVVAEMFGNKLLPIEWPEEVYQNWYALTLFFASSWAAAAVAAAAAQQMK